jgi:hypothetical protein
MPHPVLDRKVSTAQTQAAFSQANSIKLLPGESPQDVQKAKEYAQKTYMKVQHFVCPFYAPGARMLKERGADANGLKNLSEVATINLDADILNQTFARVSKLGVADSQDLEMSKMNPQTRAQVSQKMQQLQNGQWAAPNTLLPQMQQQQQGPQTCRIMPGCPVFQQIQVQSFGNSTPLVRAVGQAPPQMGSVEFIVKEVARAYIVHPNESMVDLARIQANPQMLTELVVLQAPPMSNIGMILVQKEAIANGNMSQSNNGRQIITDGRQRFVAPQQQYMHQQPIQRNVMLPQQRMQQPQQMVNANNRIPMNGRGMLKG